MRVEEILERARAGPRNLRFRDLARLIEAFGFRLVRVRGSHNIFSHATIPELVNIQSVDGKCKPYQIRQVLELVDRYNLRLEERP